MIGFVFFLTFTLAACSLLYELAIAQTVSLFAVNNVVWYSLVVGIFIGSMGIGAWLSPRLFRGEKVWGRIVGVEIFLSLVGGASVLAIHGGQMLAAGLIVGGHSIGGNVVFFAIAFIVAALVGILSGAELPLLIDLAEEASPGKEYSARIIGMDYLGSLVGAVLFAMVFVPRIDMLPLSWSIALVNVAAAALLAFRYRASGGGKDAAWLGIFGLIFVILLVATAPVQQYFLKTYYYFAYPAGEDRSDVRHFLTPYQSLDIVQLGAEKRSALPDILAAYSRKYARSPQLPHGVALYLNNDFQFYSDVEEIYHETFAHVPIAAVGRVPRTILVMGGGDGLLLRELLKYKDVEHIIQVEIDHGVVDLFRSDPQMRALNADAYQDKRLTVVFDDAYHYIRNTAQMFDAVYLDFPAPDEFGLSRLYSREFYAMVKRHVSTDGFVAVNAPGLAEDIQESGGRLKLRTWDVLSNTLSAAGFGEVRPFFSLLEDDNPEALAALGRGNPDGMDGVPPEEAEAMLRGDLQNILDGLTAGFLFVRVVPGDIASKFSDQGVPLDVMNQKRYSLATGRYPGFDREKNPRFVNSILRPRLPDLSEWGKIRTPY